MSIEHIFNPSGIPVGGAFLPNISSPSMGEGHRDISTPPFSGDGLQSLSAAWCADEENEYYQIKWWYESRRWGYILSTVYRVEVIQNSETGAIDYVSGVYGIGHAYYTPLYATVDVAYGIPWAWMPFVHQYPGFPVRPPYESLSSIVEEYWEFADQVGTFYTDADVHLHPVPEPEGTQQVDVYRYKLRLHVARYCLPADIGTNTPTASLLAGFLGLFGGNGVASQTTSLMSLGSQYFTTTQARRRSVKR